MNDIIDIGIENLDMNSSSSSSGMDYLLNDNFGSSSSSSSSKNVNFSDLEAELNNLTSVKPSSSGGVGSFFSGIFSKETDSDSKIGKASADYMGSNATKSTWDGYTKVNDASFAGSTENRYTDFSDTREKNRKKRNMLKQLDNWQKKGKITGISVTQNSTFEEVEDEYNSFKEEELKSKSIQVQKHWFLSGINAIELMNNWVNPFDIDLTGLGEKLADDIEDDDDIFEELYEKYKGGKLAPEVRLLMKIAHAAFMIHLTNQTMNSMGLGEVAKQNPELMKTLVDATVNSLNKMPEFEKNPLMNMAKDMMNEQQTKPNMMYGAPPPPIETHISKPPVGTAMQYTSRPDIAVGKGGEMFREKGIEINQSFSTLNQPEPQMSSFISEVRPEMRGPTSQIDNSQFDNIFSGLKKKDVMPQHFQRNPPQPDYKDDMVEVSTVNLDDSMISISSMKTTVNQQMPSNGKKPRRKPRSEKNSIVLDI